MPALRPRRRPRVRSISLRTLHWVLLREAVARILFHGQVVLRPGHTARWLVVTRGDVLRRHAARCLHNFPSRRFHP